MRSPEAPSDFVHGYGPDWRSGVLVDHLVAFSAAGGTIRTLASGRRQVAVLEDGTTAPLVCGDIIEIPTEDGPITGRCGLDAAPGRAACEGHAEARDHWMAMPEHDRVAVERLEAGVWA